MTIKQAQTIILEWIDGKREWDWVTSMAYKMVRA